MKRKILYALLAVLISFGLWMYVVTVVNPEWSDTFYNIPVTLQNEEILLDRGLMLTGENEPKVTLRLSGNRTDMVKLNSGNITIIADLAKIYTAGEQSVGYTIIYPGDVPSNAFEIVSQTPGMITLSVTEWKSKDVTVEDFFGESQVPENYIAFKENAVFDHEKITVTGPAEVIDKIETARVEIDLTGKTDTISQSYGFVLCDAEGNPVDDSQVKTSVEEVHYTLKIQRWKEIQLKLDIVEDNLIKESDCKITINPATIRVSGSEQVLAALQYLELGQIKLGELTKDIVNQSYEIVMPEGVTNLSEQLTATVSVDIPQLEMRQFKVTRIQTVNVPAGMKVDVITQEKVITVRGAKKVLDAMTEKDLLILVDFTNAEAGTASYKATVRVDGVLGGQVGIVGSYDITATVSSN